MCPPSKMEYGGNVEEVASLAAPVYGTHAIGQVLIAPQRLPLANMLSQVAVAFNSGTLPLKTEIIRRRLA
jgi:hypothetical protein